MGWLHDVCREIYNEIQVKIQSNPEDNRKFWAMTVKKAANSVRETPLRICTASQLAKLKFMGERLPKVGAAGTQAVNGGVNQLVPCVRYQYGGSCALPG